VVAWKASCEPTRFTSTRSPNVGAEWRESGMKIDADRPDEE
jgi:hypothetical protein